MKLSKLLIMSFKKKKIVGYNYLKSTKNFEIIYKIKDDLAKIELTKIKNNYTEFDFNLSLKQYYLNAFGTRRLEILICYLKASLYLRELFCFLEQHTPLAWIEVKSSQQKKLLF